VRRRIYELGAAGLALIAIEALSRLAELYTIESEIRGRSIEERRTARQARSGPVLDEHEPWLRSELAIISQKTKLAEAISYALARWEGLTRFVYDGRIEIDSNVVECSMWPIALNRKNALFAGSDGGAEHWTVVASLVEACKLICIEPHAYLVDVITRIVQCHPNRRLDDLLLWSYPAAQGLRAVALEHRLPPYCRAAMCSVLIELFTAWHWPRSNGWSGVRVLRGQRHVVAEVIICTSAR
jgi:hypothetical protein